jgi:hypothetical protein
MMSMAKRTIIGTHQFSGSVLTQQDKDTQARESATLEAFKNIGDKNIKAAKDEAEKDRQILLKRTIEQDLRWYQAHALSGLPGPLGDAARIFDPFYR